MKQMTHNEIKRSISNVKATITAEGLKVSRRAIVYGARMLRGDISSKEAIDNITRYHLDRFGKK